MAILSLRTFSDPFYTVTTTLEGSDYIFDFRFNQRERCWYFSISLSDGTELASGVKVVCEVSLLAPYSNVFLPQGLLIAHSNSSDTSPPGLDELGRDKRVTLLYVEAS